MQARMRALGRTILVILMPALLASAQVSSLEEWRRTREESVRLYSQGDAVAARQNAEHALALSMEMFSSSDWRVRADKLRAGFFGSSTIHPNAQAFRSDSGEADEKALEDDLAGFFEQLRAGDKRGLAMGGRAAEPPAKPLTSAAMESGRSAAPDGTRFALVVGNNHYRNPGVPPLKNAVADAQAVGDQLVKAGFKVTLLSDADLHSMQDSVHRFAKQLGSGSRHCFITQDTPSRSRM